MGFKSLSFLCLALFLTVSSSIHAFDIQKLLDRTPEFSTFNKYLNETKLVGQINRRNTITVFALDNGAMSSVSDKMPEAIRAIMATHVLLDYYDPTKLIGAMRKRELLITLYQSSGIAVDQQGYLKVNRTSDGDLAIGSAVSGAPIDVKLVKVVFAQPYNITIIQVAKPILYPGLETQTLGAPSNASAPAAETNVDVSSVFKAPPAKAKNASAPSAAEEPITEVSDSPSPSDEPSESPVEAPAKSPSLAPGPGGDEVAADAAPTSSSSRIAVGFVGAVMCFASLLVVM
ncbi:fasciclin domain protein [Medicago truncatula]|uniref:Fasciclin domain protein n=1 Tax=Medicago truncatula TaxID=3880 RepID=A0A072VE92_MEDTR|nr:fasciclin domain protein [Medicago truncatula]